jgi:hypothetical protein
MFAIRTLALGMGAAAAVLGLVAPEAIAARFIMKQPQTASKKSDSLGTFTPAAADPKRAALFGRGGFDNTGFSFTPSVTPGKSRRAVTVAIRARTSRGTQIDRILVPQTASLSPFASNLGVSLGWKRFALSGDVARINGGLLPAERESADVGLSYSGRNWSTRLLLGADRLTGERAQPLAKEDSYSVDLAGAYALTHAIEVTGGVRYKVQHDRLDQLSDVRRDSQAVYIGTAFKF